MFFLAYLISPVIGIIIQALFYGITLVNVAATLTVLLIYIGIQTEQTKDLEVELAESRMAVMLSQIQPHFLYNTLATIETFCYKDGEKAAELVREFADYLRDNMDSLEQKNPVSFTREIEHTKTYLKIEKQRFGERLNIVYDFEVTDFRLPILTVQPIVENAVRHGILKKQSGGTVSIATRAAPEGVTIVIYDDGVGFDMAEHGAQQDERSHVGIENVRERLLSQCGGKLTVESARDKGTVCKILIPAEAK